MFLLIKINIKTKTFAAWSVRRIKLTLVTLVNQVSRISHFTNSRGKMLTDM